MGVAVTVHELAKTVRTTIRPMHHHQALLVKLLELMPDFEAIHRLDVWEQACRTALPPGPPHDDVDELLHAIYDLGQVNLHETFNHKQTEEKYRQAIQQLKKRSVPIPKLQIGGLDEW